MNRKQRRAQTATPSIQTADDIPLSQPQRSANEARKTKTLYEIAAEKQAELLPGTKSFSADPSIPSNVVNVKIGPNGEIIKDGDNDEADKDIEPAPLPPVLDTLFLASSLAAIHFTLETLTVHQYAQELLFGPIFRRTFLVALPSLFLLIHLFHGHLLPSSASFITRSHRHKKTAYVFNQLVYVAIANLAGCYLIRLTNDKGYYAVMKNAPNVGTIWVWSVIELGLAGALAGVVGPAIYAWWFGYGIY